MTWKSKRCCCNRCAALQPSSTEWRSVLCTLSSILPGLENSIHQHFRMQMQAPSKGPLEIIWTKTQQRLQHLDIVEQVLLWHLPLYLADEGCRVPGLCLARYFLKHTCYRLRQSLQIPRLQKLQDFQVLLQVVVFSGDQSASSSTSNTGYHFPIVRSHCWNAVFLISRLQGRRQYSPDPMQSSELSKFHGKFKEYLIWPVHETGFFLFICFLFCFSFPEILPDSMVKIQASAYSFRKPVSYKCIACSNLVALKAASLAGSHLLGVIVLIDFQDFYPTFLPLNCWLLCNTSGH